MGLYPGGEYIVSGGLISGIITLLADGWDYIWEGNIFGGITTRGDLYPE